MTSPIQCRMSALVGLVLGVVGVGCHASPPPRAATLYLRATPIVEHGPPVVFQADADAAGGVEEAPAPVEVVSGASAPQPPAVVVPASTTPTAPINPMAVIASANATASQGPEAEGFLNAVMQYTFVRHGIYKIYAAPDNATDIILEPGESIVGEPVSGDVVRWRLAVGSSELGGVQQTHVFLKPLLPGLKTNLTINTNRRTYFLKLASVEVPDDDSDATFMVAVQWSYPESEAAAQSLAAAPPAEADARARTPRSADVAALNFDYAIETLSGKPAWRPRAVYDDGEKTFLRFDATFLTGEAPALYVRERDELQLVNYRVKGTLYVVDRLFSVAELRLGADDQDVVQIRRTTVPRPSTPAAVPAGATVPRKPGSPH